MVSSDNRPQFASEPFKKFARDWSFRHVTTSPHFQQSNGEAERAVRTTKMILKKSSDLYLALMAYHATPLANGYSPTELLIGRRIKTTVHVIPSQLNLRCADMKDLKNTDRRYRKKQCQNFNQRHRACDLTQLQHGDHVWAKDMLMRGTVVSPASTPRSRCQGTPYKETGTTSRQLLRHLKTLLNLPETSSNITHTEKAPADPEVQHDSSQKTPESKRRFPTRQSTSSIPEGLCLLIKGCDGQQNKEKMPHVLMC